MEKQITINNEYNSLDAILAYLKKDSSYECAEVYDSWDVRTDPNGQMEKCILIKKSAMHGMKLYFLNTNVLKLTYIIPNKLMNAYFGKSEKRHRGILEIIGGIIKNALLSGSQKKAFNEMEQPILKIAAL